MARYIAAQALCTLCMNVYVPMASTRYCITYRQEWQLLQHISQHCIGSLYCEKLQISASNEKCGHHQCTHQCMVLRGFMRSDVETHVHVSNVSRTDFDCFQISSMQCAREGLSQHPHQLACRGAVLA